jgi:hypothetical protein
MTDITQAGPPLVFDWHAEQAVNPDGMLAWLLPTTMRRDDDFERLSTLTDRFTRCELRITLNGVDMDVRAFLDGVGRTLEHAARTEAKRLVRDSAGLDEVEDAVAVARDAIRSTLLERLRAAGVAIEEADDD